MLCTLGALGPLLSAMFFVISSFDTAGQTARSNADWRLYLSDPGVDKVLVKPAQFNSVSLFARCSATNLLVY